MAASLHDLGGQGVGCVDIGRFGPRSGKQRGWGVNAKPAQSSVYSIPKAAQRAGLTVHQVRTYLVMGLVRPCAATHGGYRLLDTNCVERLKLIKACRDADLGLSEIAGLVHALDGEDAARRAEAQRTLRARINDKRRALSRCAWVLDRACTQEHTNADAR